MNQSSAVMVGLAGAGKTSFLAALYHVAETEMVPGSLILARIPPLREHLERIRLDWLSVVPQTRTITNVLEHNVLEMRDRADGGSLSLFFPDLAGEQLAALVEERLYTTEFAAVLEGVDRVLLFIHPDKVIESPTIREVEELAELLGNIVTNSGADGPVDPAQHTVPTDADQSSLATASEWDVRKVSTQVKLVELLQVVESLSAGLRKIGVVISAWDRLRALGVTPDEWIHQRLPLLAQYLDSHRIGTPVEVFGVSALGGDPDADKQELALKECQVDRIEVVGAAAGHDSRDMTYLVRWLFA